MLRDGTDQVSDMGLCGIGFRGTHVTDNLCPVQGDPIERLQSTLSHKTPKKRSTRFEGGGVYGVGKVVDVVPGEFLGEEVFHSS